MNSKTNHVRASSSPSPSVPPLFARFYWAVFAHPFLSCQFIHWFSWPFASCVCVCVFSLFFGALAKWTECSFLAYLFGPCLQFCWLPLPSIHFSIHHLHKMSILFILSHRRRARKTSTRAEAHLVAAPASAPAACSLCWRRIFQLLLQFKFCHHDKRGRE